MKTDVKKLIEMIIGTETNCDVCGDSICEDASYGRAEFARDCNNGFDICSRCWQNKVKPWLESQKKK